jgi:hypothetical protein
MPIIGCDFHTRYQQNAMLDEGTGELTERTSGQRIPVQRTNAPHRWPVFWPRRPCYLAFASASTARANITAKPSPQ